MKKKIILSFLSLSAGTLLVWALVRTFAVSSEDVALIRRVMSPWGAAWIMFFLLLYSLLIFMIVGAFGGLIAGLGISTGMYEQKMFSFAVGSSGKVGVWFGILPFLLLILVAGFMLSGQEQFVMEGDEH